MLMAAAVGGCAAAGSGCVDGGRGRVAAGRQRKRDIVYRGVDSTQRYRG